MEGQRSAGPDQPLRSPEYEEFLRLARRYRRLAWPKSVTEQRERDQLNKELMRLYVRLYPNSPYREWDDFDVVSRSLPVTRIRPAS